MMSDFTGGGIDALPSDQSATSGESTLDQKIRDLIKESGCTAPQGLVAELVNTALKIGKDNLSIADLKLFNRSLKELHNAARVFSHYSQRPKVAVFGSARTKPDALDYKAAVDFGRKMRERGYMIITGGGDGIMGAAQEGAGREASFGLNIRLPFEQKANDIIEGDEKLITFNYFFTRKLNFVKETSAVALFPGGFGTFDEGFEVITLLQTGKARIFPIVFIDEPGGSYWLKMVTYFKDNLLSRGLISPDDFSLFYLATGVDDAVIHIEQFYRNFISYRWVRNRLVIRLKEALTPEAIERLNCDFKDVIQTGRIVETLPLPEEANEPHLAQNPRLVLTPNRRNFGRLRALIDAINASPVIPINCEEVCARKDSAV